MEIFSIEYGNGHISVNVNNYFVKADLPSIKKFFKVARDFCTENQKASLIEALREAKNYWQKKFEKGKERYSQNVADILTPSTRNQLLKLQAKLDRVIEILEAESWKDEISQH